MAIAVIRYYLAVTVANHRPIRNWWINMFTGFSTGIVIFLGVLKAYATISLNASFGPAVGACVGPGTDVESQKLGPKISTAIGMLSLITGVVFDCAMWKFLKDRRKKLQPAVALVHWAKTASTTPGQPETSIQGNIKIGVQSCCV